MKTGRWILFGMAAALLLAGCAGNTVGYGDSTAAADDWVYTGEATDAFPKAFEYSSPELRYVSSSAPIPAAHLACMKIVDEQIARGLTLVNQEQHNVISLKLYRDMVGLANVDWGISARVNYAQDAEEFAAKVPADKENVAKERRALIERERKAGLMVAERGFEQPLAVASHAAALGAMSYAVKYARDAYLSAQYRLNIDSGIAGFDRCVARNGLPPTVR